MDFKGKALLILFAAIALMIIIIAIIGIIKNSEYKKEIKKKAKEGNEEAKSLLEKLNQSSIVVLLQRLSGSELKEIFYKAKNPWGITPGIFQLIRFGGAALCAIASAFCLFIDINISIFILGIAVLFVWYPMYFYKATGKEREEEWNKMYEFIWVLKHNAMLYDPAKTFLNTTKYIQEHAPHDKEIIQGFKDFYDNWNEEEIPEYIHKYYSFPVPKEIYQIIFNMYKSGEFPEDQLNSLRTFIVNHQNLTVEKTLSGVSGKATIYSLPFMMVSVIVALMIPMVFQLIQFM